MERNKIIMSLLSCMLVMCFVTFSYEKKLADVEEEFIQYKKEKTEIIEENSIVIGTLEKEIKKIQATNTKNQNELKEKQNQLNDLQSKLDREMNEVKSLQSELNKAKKENEELYEKKVEVFEVTAYTDGYESTQKHAGEAGYGVMANGEKTYNGAIACPREYKFGTKMKIEGMGVYTCSDRGGDIKGNRLDIYMASLSKAQTFGRKKLSVEIL